jgi:hypothetical protein
MRKTSLVYPQEGLIHSCFSFFSLMLTLVIGMGLLTALPRVALADADGNSTYESATVLTLGQLRVTDSLEGGINRPDTLLGVFENDQFTGSPLLIDDNGSRVGDGRASGLYGSLLTGQDSINFQISGVGDTSFDGSHSEAGVLDVYFEAFSETGASLANFYSPRVALDPGMVLPYTLEVDPAWAGGTYNIFVDNSVIFGGPDPRDFYRFQGLPAGASFVASTEATTLDTTLGWYSDSVDQLLDSNDDFGNRLTSRLEGIVPASGEIVLVVTGYPDEDFQSPHPQTGTFVLNVEFPELNLTDADLNDDGLTDILDVDLLTAEIVADRDHLFFDLNGDLQVNVDDLNLWLDEALPGPAAYLNGDANLDGFVDVSDFNLWFSHRQLTEVGWSGGDFNADGIADSADLTLWNANRFRGEPVVAANSVVPEPASGAAALMAMVLLSFRVWRRRG